MSAPRPWGPETSQVDRIAGLLPVEQRSGFLSLMANLRDIPEDDEILRILEAMGYLAVITRQVPDAIAEERIKFEGMLRSSEAGMSGAEFAGMVRELSAPDTGVVARINRALGLMRAETQNASAHVKAMTENLNRELRRSVVLIAVASGVAGFLIGKLS